MTTDDDRATMKLADMAMKAVDQGDKLSHEEQRITMYTRASALVSLAVFSEVRKLREVVEKGQATGD